MRFQEVLHYDPIQPLIGCNSPVLQYFVHRDLLGEPVPLGTYIADQDEVVTIIKKQNSDGTWGSISTREPTTTQNKALVQTWKQFRFLVEKYELDRSHRAVAKAAEYIFSCQSPEGDIRGMLGNQYAMYYTGAMLSLLIKAGYQEDTRVERGIEWLLSMRQDDGGWVGTPYMTVDHLTGQDKLELITDSDQPLTEHDKSRPLCLNSTGMAIRALACHPRYRQTAQARGAAEVLKRHFFTPNHYPSYRHRDNWLVFQYPYWWNNLVAALDSVSLIITDKRDPDIARAVAWFVEHQGSNGLWKRSYSGIHKSPQSAHSHEAELWITFVICRILNRLFSDPM